MEFDAHNHLLDPRLGDAESIVDSMRAAGISGCVVNATREEDWENVANLTSKHPGWVFPAFGIHPWHAHTARSGWVDRLELQMNQFPHSSVGECGLDQWVTTPTLDIQKPVFESQLRLARQLQRPITIHCLKAWGALFESFASEPPPPRFLLHSFSGSNEIAQRLIPLGAYFSFSGHFLHERKLPTLEVFKKLPLERILLETDAPDMLPPPAHITHPMAGPLNHPANLHAIGRGLATALNISHVTLAQITRDNTRACFGLEET